MFRAGYCPSSGEYDTVHISDWYQSIKTPDDRQCPARNMQRLTISEIYTYQLHQAGVLIYHYMMHGNTKLKFIDAKQAKDFFKYKNTKRKLYKVNSAIWYNKRLTISEIYTYQLHEAGVLIYHKHAYFYSYIIYKSLSTHQISYVSLTETYKIKFHRYNRSTKNATQKFQYLPWSRVGRGKLSSL